MAAAAPSPLASSVEKTNGAKLSRLLIDGGTTVLRTIFDHYHPPANLLANLNANYHTLNNLLRRRVLHRPQWDLLFPPGGATPDSNTFDITLFFLLLTNICGLSPPLSGWHAQPRPSDNSFEANLARIKFFRNELYGHVTTTGVDTRTFSTLWLEISAVLVALGLNQAEIDRLKAERCGEEDYIDVLLEWADSEEDIKSQLKDMRQSQTKVQQTVVEVHKTQLEDHKILKDSKVELEEVHQVQVITQKTIDEVRQTQLEDRWKLEEVVQVERTTHHVVTESRQTQINDSRAIQEIRQTQANTEKVLQETKAKVEGVSECLETLQLQFQQKRESQEGERSKPRGDEILKNLANIASLKDIRHHTERYVKGTRLSIFAKVESWLNDRNSPNHVMVITGNPGMGKSVISAVTCQKMLEAGRLAGSHFCQHDRARHRNPKVMLQSLASHLADSLPHYKKALVEKLSRNLGVQMNDMEVKDLFELLFEESITSLNDPGLTYLLVIDGIDESEYQGRNELLDVIADYFKKLPSWIRFLVTTRPEVNIADRLKSLQPVQLEPNSEENLKDIRVCLKDQLHDVLPSKKQEIILEALVQKSEGVMLYAHYLIDLIIKEVTLTPELLDVTFPSGISSVYQSYFARLETDLRKGLKVTEEQFMNFLSAVAAAREPLPLGFVSRLLLSGSSPSAVQRRKVVQAISCVSALLPVQDGRIHFFHKSVKDWLIEKSSYGQHHFSVDENDGHLVLSNLCIDEFDNVKRKGVDGAQFSDSTKYALQHGVQHMLEVEENRKSCRFEEVVQRYVLDLELLYAKLLVNTTVAFTDILCALEKEAVEPSEKFNGTLSSLLSLLRKHIDTLKELPSAIFQTLLNEGGPELSSKAFHILETKYPEIPCMEYLDKNIEGRVQTRFQCSDSVACFDVSPQLDYMVCECRDNTIQLWSLLTGEHLWTRPTEVWRNYKFFPYSIDVMGQSDSRALFYRSVVFYPLEDLVLPGILSHAYAFDGELKPLFTSSKCRFSVCSISRDKTKMLTDCPDNAKSIIMWSLTDGSEILNFAWDEPVSSFAWSHNGWLLAISTPDFISLVDMMDGFKTLAETTIPCECGMIRFSPDCQFLFHSHSGGYGCFGNGNQLSCFLVKMDNQSNYSLDVLSGDLSCHPWEFESRSETGFLLGDPFCYPPEESSSTFAFVLNKQSVLKVSPPDDVIEMLYRDNLPSDTLSKDELSNTAVEKVELSLNGDTLYVITGSCLDTRTVKTWDISSGKFKANVHVNNFCCLLAVKEGILFNTGDVLSETHTLELWNFELSECIRSWTDIGYTSNLIPKSEELVVCELWGGDKVIILDTTSGDIVSTIISDGSIVACNSERQLMMTEMTSEWTSESTSELLMKCGDDEDWKIVPPFNPLPFREYNTFSPTMQYCVIGGTELPTDRYHVDHIYLYVLDAASGTTLHSLCCSSQYNKLDCKFVSNEECVINNDVPRGYCLRLFNVKSGDLLSEIIMESTVSSLAVCPHKRLVAIGLRDSKHGIKILKLKLPRDEESRKTKR